MRISLACALALSPLTVPALALAQTGHAQMDHTSHGHAGHDMTGMVQPAPEEDGQSHAGHGSNDATTMPDDHHGHGGKAGHHTMASDTGSDMSAMAMPDTAPVPHAPPPAAAFSGPAHAADQIYSPEAMGEARHMVTHEMGGMRTTFVQLDRLELQPTKGADGLAFEAGIRTGGDIDRIWIKTEGEGEIGSGIEEAEVSALWSHAIGAWFDLQGGVRQRLREGPDRTELAVGVQGLAPYMFELDAAAYLSTHGELTAAVSAEVDQRLTQRLILQPRVEAQLSAQDIPELETGSGLTSLEAGLRLRYEFAREFAPYIGVEWQKKFGATARYARAASEDPDRIVAVLGIRAWF